ncbi:MAG: ferrous iron transport protein B [Planctomycetota bacterium]|nr:ferrous iron transport protein B [Planctomycetota bacterium]
MAFDHTFYLAGNPNSGKTSLFNSITGLRHHTGNYPGVTVERLEGSKTFKDRKLRFIDLPGSYNLTSYSIEERVARDALLEDPPDAVINVVDATNLERNLYLALSLMEMGVNVVIALNMSDLAKRNGIIIDTRMLEENLKVPVVETVAIKGEGVEELLEKAIESTSRIGPPLKVNYGKVIERELELVEEYLEGHEEKLRGNVRWTAVKLIEGDENVTEKVIESLGDEDFAQALEDARNRIESMFSDTVEVVMAERRYGVISGVSHPAIKYTVDARHTFSDQIDMVLTNRFAGIPIFLIMMYLVFYATFKVGEYPMLWLESFFGWLSASIASSWSEATMPLLRSLLIDGIIGGVGGVLVFLPNIIILFFAIALLEDSGYMARAAFLTDRFMRAMGLPGKSFIPILVGFGCTVPAVSCYQVS